MTVWNWVSAKKVTIGGFVTGVVLIGLFPFGLLHILIPQNREPFFCRAFEFLLHNGNKCMRSDGLYGLLADHAWWEVTAYSWTVLFTITFIWVGLPEQYQQLNTGQPPGQHERWSAHLLTTVMFGIVISGIVYSFGWVVDTKYSYRVSLWAKVILAFTIVYANFRIIWRADRLAKSGVGTPVFQPLDHIRREFRHINGTLDMPTAFALALLSLWDWLLPESSAGNQEFISGASSAILIITGFIFGLNMLRD